MNTFDNTLLEQYPSLFPTDNEGKPKQPVYGIYCPQGWEHIVDTMFDTIVGTGKPFTIRQVKEKLGGLRIYYTCSNEYVQGIVTFAICLAEKTCEDSGAPGVLCQTPSGWLKTLSPAKLLTDSYEEYTPVTKLKNK